jgi:hypothetical protein
MSTIRYLLVTAVISVLFIPSAHAQAGSSPFRIDTRKFALQQTSPVAAQMHPAVKGAIIGGAIGAGTFGAIGLWYCTIGPHEVGECGPRQWLGQGLLVYGGAGAAIGALIGAIKAR